VSGIQFVANGKARKVAVQIDLKKYGSLWEDFRDGWFRKRAERKRGQRWRRSKRTLGGAAGCMDD
jgi:hypothetical protein